MIIDIPAADTVENGHLAGSPGKLPAFIPHQNFAAGGSGGIAETLEFKTGEYIGIGPISVLLNAGGIKGVIAGSQNDAADL